MTPDQPLDKARLEHMGAQTVDCLGCGKTGIPLYQFENELESLCAACLIERWQEITYGAWSDSERDA